MASDLKRSCLIEEKNEWNLEKVLRLCEDEGRVVNFLREKGLLKGEMKCDKCGWGMREYGRTWKCNKRVKTKRGRKICGRKTSIFKGTWFGRTKLNIKNVMSLSYMLINNYEHKKISKELGISEGTVSQWSHFVKQVLVEWLMSESQPIGGPRKTVQIQRSKFENRKYNRGCAVEGQWVLGGMEKETQRVFLFPIPDWNTHTLIPLIKQWILPGSTIISDCLKALNEDGYEHLRVNHSLNFIDFETGVHTNTMETILSPFKKFLPSYCRKKDNFPLHLAQCMFNKIAKEKKVDLFEAFLKEIAKVRFDCEGESLDEIC